MRLFRVGALVVLVSLVGCSLFSSLRGDDDERSSVAPPDSMKPNAYAQAKPASYSGGIAWLNATTNLAAENRAGNVYMKWLKLEGVFADGSRTLLQMDNYTRDQRASGGVFTRGIEVGGEGWFVRMITSGGFTFKELVSTEERFWVFVLPTGSQPQCVYHAWVNDWPRATVPSNVTQIVGSALLACEGAALAQVGADYWPEPGSTTDREPPPQVVEAGASRWISAADGWVTLELGR